MTYIRIRYKKRGSHYFCQVFTARNYDGTYANCGLLTFAEHEWPDIRDKFDRAEFVEEGKP